MRTTLYDAPIKAQSSILALDRLMQKLLHVVDDTTDEMCEIICQQFCF